MPGQGDHWHGEQIYTLMVLQFCFAVCSIGCFARLGAHTGASSLTLCEQVRNGRYDTKAASKMRVHSFSASG
jgi:hypothetical protein